MKILITGSAGFIGFHLSTLFLKNGHDVIGVDNLCKSYGIRPKIRRLKELKKNKKFKFYKIDISEIKKIKEKKIDYIIHLAAQAGVRLSQEKPELFIKDNILGTVKIFDFAIKNKIKNLFYASSSSVYGNSNIFPSHESINTNKPLSIYGITKASNEDLAYYYNYVYGINSIGFRFFTVYGPYGRPDMSIGIFFRSFLKKQTIYLFNKGNNYRDFTYVDDIVNQIYSCFKKTQKKNKFLKIFNIGGESTILVKNLVKLIQKITGKKTKILLSKKNKLDPIKSLADNKDIVKFSGYTKKTKITDGLKKVYEDLVSQN